jgi:riboflavin biosynthesis pyrimidine reductase
MHGILSSMRRLFPHAATEPSLRECYDVPRPKPPGRPWVALCMVASLDGSTVVGGTSRFLSNPVDQELLLTLRTLVDVVVVGASTARKEGYGPPRSPNLRLAVVSRSGDFDFDAPIWQSDRSLLIMPEDGPEVPVPTIRAGVGDVDLAAALAQLDADVVQAEGGASLNGQLAAAGLVDELNLTISPQLAGGVGPRLLDRAPDLAQRMQLVHVLEDDGFLFARYVRAD